MLRKIKTLFFVLKRYVQILCWSKSFYREKIKSNKIIFWSFRGRTYSCNPKYITEHILRSCPNDFEIVWAFNDEKKFLFLKEKNIRVVKYYSKEFFFELMTSKFVVTNTRIGIDFHKRLGQIYIQTWHGTMALKKIEKDAWKSLKLLYVINSFFDSRKMDVLLSGCKANTNVFNKSFWYKGPVLEIGNPRNDIFFNRDNIREKIDKLYGTSNKGIILYAPTFRKNKSIDVYSIDYEQVLKRISEKFGNDYVFFIRLHPNIKQMKMVNLPPDVVNVSDYDDMQELLCAADVLITDFSSSMFDFALMKKICFLFAVDYNEYVSEERGVYFDVRKDLPFPLATSNTELNSVIDGFDIEKYKEALNSFCEQMVFFEKGDASSNLVQKMKKMMENNG